MCTIVVSSYCDNCHHHATQWFVQTILTLHLYISKKCLWLTLYGILLEQRNLNGEIIVHSHLHVR